MTSSPLDTIVAPITGSHPAAVAIVRISGERAWSIAAAVFCNWPEQPEHHRAMYGRYSTGDDGIALPFSAGHSYTGEESVELSCHGSPAAVVALIEACIREGARYAEAGEFTQRAFLNGRIDLTEAEAVADTVNALTGAQLRIANRQREGALFQEVSLLRAEVLRVLAAVEASVDFEEEIGPLDRGAAAEQLLGIEASVDRLIQTSEIGRIMRKGLRIAIVGPPNAGKSSLFNALVGRERAIVTEVPGTTRDFLEEQLDFSGVPVVLIDTAGLRKTDDRVESIGVQRSLAEAASADVVWYVYDATLGPTAQDYDFPDAWFLANKSDLGVTKRPDHLQISAITGHGLDTLARRVAAYAEQAEALKVPPVNDRHAALLSEAKEAVGNALATVKNGRPDDLLTTFLRSAEHSLGEITGETASHDMIEKIFADFCIGK